MKRFPKVEIKGEQYIEFEDNLEINGYCYIGTGTYWSAKGGIEIGDNVIFGPFTSILSYNHNYEGDMIPYGGNDILKKVTIKDNVWIGMKTLILPGVTIEEGVVVAAGSVVTKSIPKYSIVGGNPARVLKIRDELHYEEYKRKQMKYQNLKNN